MPRKTDRDFTQAFQASGILDGLVGPLVSDNIQMVYQLGDLGELLNIVRFPRRYTSASSPAVVGNFSTLKVIPPPDGALLMFHIRNTSAVDLISLMVTPNAALVGESALTVGFETQGPTRGAFSFGSTLATLGTGFILPPASDVAFANQRPVIVQPGEMITLQGIAANTLLDICQFAWQEIPRAPIAR